MGNKVSKGNIEKQYLFKNQLGKGAFAVVKRAIRKSDAKEFAIKIIKKDNLNSEDLAIVEDEVDIMQKITHPHCVQLYDFMNTKKTCAPLVLPYLFFLCCHPVSHGFRAACIW